MMRSLLTGYRRWVRNNLDIAALPFVLVVVVVVMTAVTSGRFLSFANFRGVSFQLPELGLLSLAMMITMVTGGINLSIIASANLCGVIMALMLAKVLPLVPWAGATIPFIMLTILLGLVVSLLLGAINGLLIAYIGVSPVLATLGTMIFYEGLTLSITKGFVISGFPDQFLAIGAGSLLGVPYAMVVFIACAMALSIVYRRMPFGKRLYMIGSNDIAARFSGIDTKLMLLKTYLISGLLCGIASVIMMSRFNSANARNGASFLLLTVLISVLGGTDPYGGFGRISGIVLALCTLQFLSSGLNLLGVTTFVTVSLWGIILTLVIGWRYFSAKTRDRTLIMQIESNSS